MGRTGIYACGESVRRRNSLESVALFSLKQEAPASIGGSTFTPKTDKSIRTVYISDFLSQLLEQLKRKQIKYLESKGYINEDNYVFLAVRRRHDCLVCRLCFHVGCRLCRFRRRRPVCPQFGPHAL